MKNNIIFDTTVYVLLFTSDVNSRGFSQFCFNGVNKIAYESFYKTLKLWSYIFINVSKAMNIFCPVSKTAGTLCCGTNNGEQSRVGQ